MNNNSFMDTNQDNLDIDTIFDGLKDSSLDNTCGYFNQYDDDGGDITQMLCLGLI